MASARSWQNRASLFSREFATRRSKHFGHQPPALDSALEGTPQQRAQCLALNHPGCAGLAFYAFCCRTDCLLACGLTVHWSGPPTAARLPARSIQVLGANEYATHSRDTLASANTRAVGVHFCRLFILLVLFVSYDLAKLRGYKVSV